MARAMTTAVVPAGTDLGNQEDVTVLHTYANGDRLVEAPEATVARTETARRVPPPPPTPRAEAARPGVDSLAAGEEAFARVELAGPSEKSVVELLEAAGVALVTFEPPSGYLVRGDRAALEAVAALPVVRAVSLPTAGSKPRARMPEAGTRDVWVVLHVRTAEQTLAQLRQVADLALAGDLEPPGGPYRRVAATADGGAVDAALALPGVASVEEREPVLPEDEVADLIIAGMLDSQRRPVGNYLRWLEDHGVDGAGVTIGIVDDGVDESHDAFTGRIVSHDGNRKEWHGTFVAGHAAGDFRDERDAHGFIYGVGMAPGADLVTQSSSDSAAANCRRTVTTAGASRGATGSLQNNSWGAGTAPGGMDYGSLEATYDGLVRDADGTDTPLTICFSAGNEGSDGLTRPKAAKNVIVTGNSESYRPEFATDKPTAAAEADNPDEMFTGHGASSHGNCLDGRIRPHVCAPGEWTAAANFGLTSEAIEYISDQLTWGGGTSGASPKTTGACALAVDWWADNIGGAAPSPAMLRALMVNGATDTGFGGPVPNNRQGWGRINLGAVFDESVHKLYVDQSILLTSLGDCRRWNLQVSDPTKPVKVTLTWTDPPGSVGSGTADRPAIVNRLRLQVENGGTTYYGNDFSNGWSRAGSPPDDEGHDNTVNVHLRGGEVTGTFTVTVEALQLAMNCLTNQATDPQQDFALVVHNAHLDAGMTPVDTTVIVDDASGQPGDGDGGDHWDGDDDGTNDGDDTWGDGTDRPTLRYGDQGSDVRDLQQLLTDLGYDTNGVDGDFGGGTLSAVCQFQRDQGLGDDGVVGAMTWEALDRATSGSSGGSDPGGWTDPDPGGWTDPEPVTDPDPGTEPGGSGIDTSNRPTLRRGDQGSDVRDLQQLLNDLGYDTNGIDGDFGGGTLAAVQAFQGDEGLPADGVVGDMTWARLGERAVTTGGTTDDDWGAWDDVDDWNEARRRRESAPRPATPPVAGELVAAMAEEPGAVPAGEAGARPGSAEAAVVGSLRTRLAELSRAWAVPTDDDGTIRARSAIVVVGRGSRFDRNDLVALRRLGRLGTLFLLSDDRQVLGWLAQRLQVGRGIHYRLTTGPDGPAAAARDAVAEAHGRHRLVVPLRTNDDGTAVAARLDLTELDRHVVVVVRNASPTLRLTDPEGKETTVTARSRATGVRLTALDDTTGRLTLDGADRPLAGTWVVEAPVTGGAAPTFEATVAGRRPAVLRVAGAGGAPATESGRSPKGLLTVTATSGSLLQTRIRQVSATESAAGRVDLRPAVRRIGRHSEATVATEHGAAPAVSAPSLTGVLPAAGSRGVTDVVVETRGVTAGGHRFQRSQHEDVVSVLSRSEHRRERGRRRDSLDLLRGRVREVQYDGAGRVTALLVRTTAERRLLRVEDVALRALLGEVDLTRGDYLFGLDGNVVRSVVDPFEVSA
jgi:peptidoglycan hydrolase-like protein with peptidoglycan-binding domain